MEKEAMTPRDRFAFEDLTPEATDRFHSRIEVEPEGCWLWTGTGRTTAGIFYPMLSVRGKQRSARVLAYMLHCKKAPKGLVEMRCKNSRCVNPSHTQDFMPVDHSGGKGKTR